MFFCKMVKNKLTLFNVNFRPAIYSRRAKLHKICPANTILQGHYRELIGTLQRHYRDATL